MNAQEIINESNYNSDKNLKLFYPTLYNQKLTDYNLTKCLNNLK